MLCFLIFANITWRNYQQTEKQGAHLDFKHQIKSSNNKLKYMTIKVWPLKAEAMQAI
jgi:hypothetical protein